MHNLYLSPLFPFLETAQRGPFGRIVRHYDLVAGVIYGCNRVQQPVNNSSLVVGRQKDRYKRRVSCLCFYSVHAPRLFHLSQRKREKQSSLVSWSPIWLSSLLRVSISPKKIEIATASVVSIRRNCVQRFSNQSLRRGRSRNRRRRRQGQGRCPSLRRRQHRSGWRERRRHGFILVRATAAQAQEQGSQQHGSGRIDSAAGGIRSGRKGHGAVPLVCSTSRGFSRMI